MCSRCEIGLIKTELVDPLAASTDRDGNSGGNSPDMEGITGNRVRQVKRTLCFVKSQIIEPFISGEDTEVGEK